MKIQSTGTLTIAAIVLTAVATVGSFTAKKLKTPESASQINITESEGITESPVRTLTVTAVGDCTFATDDYASRDLGFVSYAERYGTDYFLKNVKGIFSEDDLTIVNFEGTLSDRGERENKQFAFRGDPSYVNALTSSSVEAANLANNHSMDYGSISLDDTKMYLDKAGILHCRDTDDICITEINGIKVGLVGINYLNTDMKTRLKTAIKSAKDSGAEIVILSIHWGVEKATAPGDEEIKAAHTAIDCGADLVIGTHPHVLQGFEKYKGRYICYSLGNFCFGGNNAPSDMDTAIFRQTFTLTSEGLADDDAVTIIPCRISASDGYNDYCPTPAQGDTKTRIENKITQYTSALGDLTLNFR
ncbi:MAG: CapA family protein [Oscillospiraceae bacterium]|nr:CapA family protein [Oscillospiraceae bacterium]